MFSTPLAQTEQVIFVLVLDSGCPFKLLLSDVVGLFTEPVSDDHSAVCSEVTKQPRLKRLKSEEFSRFLPEHLAVFDPPGVSESPKQIKNARLPPRVHGIEEF